MKKNMIHVNWNKSRIKTDINPILEKYENYLRSSGFRESSIIRYRVLIKRYINKTKSIKPNIDNAIAFRDELLKSNLKHSTVNLYFAAIRQFHKMHNEDIEFPYLPVNNKLPYYLSSDDVLKILSIIPNLKHYCMVVAMKTPKKGQLAAISALQVFIFLHFISCFDNGFDHFIQAHRC